MKEQIPSPTVFLPEQRYKEDARMMPLGIFDDNIWHGLAAANESNMPCRRVIGLHFVPVNVR